MSVGISVGISVWIYSILSNKCPHPSFATASGDLPIPVVLLLSLMCSQRKSGVKMKKSGPGFTLPPNIGDLGPSITILNLAGCNLRGVSI